MSAMKSPFVCHVLLKGVAQNWQAVQTRSCVIPFSLQAWVFLESFSPSKLYNYRRLDSFSEWEGGQAPTKDNCGSDQAQR